MKLSALALLFVAFALIASAANPPPVNDAKAGAELAEKVRGMAPAENAELTGLLDLERPNADENFIPVRSSIIITNDGWRTIYSARTPTGEETLSVLHRANKASVYTYALAGRDSVSLVGDRATNSFAGSDFSLLDLGLEFFHWSTQVLVTRQMKKGRGCDVLESRPANVTLYSRVVSWLDQETGGLLMAEAYDANGKLLKEFEVSKFDRKAGQVREVEIRNRQTKSSTRLRFDTGAK
jgi:outer membrane lipoprotein-sorting protein